MSFEVNTPGALQPVYIVKDAEPDGFWTYPSVALSTTLAETILDTEQRRLRYATVLRAILILIA